MKNNFSDFSEVLKYIIENSGKDILKDKKKTNGFISDLAPGDKFNAEKKLLNDAYSYNAVRILLDADTEPDRHHKAVETAKGKLTNNYISSDGADVIIKAICSALGWDTQSLFSKQTVEPQKQEAVTHKPQSEQYDQTHTNSRAPEQKPIIPQQPMQYSQPYNNVQPVMEPMQQAYSQPIQVIQQDKKSPLTTLLKLTALVALIVIIFTVVKRDNANDEIVTETQAAAAEATEQITESLTEESEQVTEITSTTTVQTSAEPVAVSETTTASETETTVSETQTTEIAVEAAAIPETFSVETTQVTTDTTTTTAAATTVTTTAATTAATSAQEISDGIDWDSIPYANEEDFNFSSYITNKISIVLNRYDGSEKVVKIPLQIGDQKINTIGVAFKANKNITDINIPVGVTLIENQAFLNCTNLKSVVIPNGVTFIGESCFWRCENLEFVNIPDGVKTIGSSAFRACPKLTNIYLPDSIEEFGYAVFSGNENIKVTYKGVVYDADHLNELREAIN